MRKKKVHNYCKILIHLLLLSVFPVNISYKSTSHFWDMILQAITTIYQLCKVTGQLYIALRCCQHSDPYQYHWELCVCVFGMWLCLACFLRSITHCCLNQTHLAKVHLYHNHARKSCLPLLIFIKIIQEKISSLYIFLYTICSLGVASFPAVFLKQWSVPPILVIYRLAFIMLLCSVLAFSSWSCLDI
jgi:hypothetical protein